MQELELSDCFKMVLQPLKCLNYILVELIRRYVYYQTESGHGLEHVPTIRVDPTLFSCHHFAERREKNDLALLGSKPACLLIMLTLPVTPQPHGQVNFTCALASKKSNLIVTFSKIFELFQTQFHSKMFEFQHLIWIQ